MGMITRAQVHGEFSASDAIGKTLNNPSFIFSPQAQRDKVVAGATVQAHSTAQTALGNNAGTAAVGTEASNTASSIMSSANDQIASASQADFPKFVAVNDSKGVGGAVQKLDFTNPASFGDKGPVVQSMISNVKGTYKHMYSTEPQFWRGAALSKDQSTNLSKSLKDPTISTEATTLGIKALQKAYGSNFPELMDQMIKDGNLHEGWRYAAIVPQYLSSADVVGALKGRDGALMKNFETSAGPTAKKDLESAISGDDTLKKFIWAQNQQNPNQPLQDNETNALQEVVKTKAMQLYTQSGGGISLPDAVKQSSDSLIGRNVHFIDVGQSRLFGLLGPTAAKKSLIALPKQMGDYPIGEGEAGKIKDYLNSNLSPEALKAFKVMPPPQSNGVPTQFGEEFYKQASDSARYTVDPNHKGFRLQWKDAAANKWVDAMVPDKNGRPTPFFLPIGHVLNSKGAK